MYHPLRFTLILTTFFALSQGAQAHSWAQEKLASMSLPEKIGQLFMVAIAADPLWVPLLKHHGLNADPVYVQQLTTEYHIGGIIFLGKSTKQQLQSTAQQLQTQAKIPLLVGYDNEGITVTRLYDGIHFPYAMALGAVQNEQLIYEVGKAIGDEARALGVHIIFAPVVDVNNNPHNPVINVRSFGNNPQDVARKGLLFSRGLRDGGVIPCAKHFIGHGDTTVDSHYGLPYIAHNLERLHTVELLPFKHLIEKDIEALMTAHLEVPALDPTIHLPTSLSRTIITDLLRYELGFNGLIITDALNMHGITQYYSAAEAAFKAVHAGNDILLCPPDVPAAAARIAQALESGQLSEGELDAHVLKILTAKERFFAGTQATVHCAHNEAHALLTKVYQATMTAVRDPEHRIGTPSTPTTIHVRIGTPSMTTIDDALGLPVYALSSAPTEVEYTQFLEHLPHDKELIITLFGSTRNAKQRHGISPLVSDFLTRVSSQSMLVIFGSPYSLAHTPVDLPTLIAYDDSVNAQQNAAQVLLGQQTASGSLPIPLPENT